MTVGIPIYGNLHLNFRGVKSLVSLRFCGKASTHEGENCCDCSRLIREEQKCRGRVLLCLAGGLQESALYKFNGEADFPMGFFWSCFLLKATKVMGRSSKVMVNARNGLRTPGTLRVNQQLSKVKLNDMRVLHSSRCRIDPLEQKSGTVLSLIGFETCRWRWRSAESRMILPYFASWICHRPSEQLNGCNNVVSSWQSQWASQGDLTITMGGLEGD